MAGDKRLLQFPPRQAALWPEQDGVGELSPVEYATIMRELNLGAAGARREFDIGDLRKPVRSASLDARAGQGSGSV